MGLGGLTCSCLDTAPDVPGFQTLNLAFELALSGSQVP